MSTKPDVVEQLLWLPTIFVAAPLAGGALGVFLNAFAKTVMGIPEWATVTALAAWALATLAFFRIRSIDPEGAKLFLSLMKLFASIAVVALVALSVSQLMSPLLSQSLILNQTQSGDGAGRMQSVGIQVACVARYYPLGAGIAAALLGGGIYLDAFFRTRAQN